MVESLKLPGAVRRLDGKNPNELIVDVDPNISQKIGTQGIPMGAPGHCTVVTPLINRDVAEETSNGKGIVGKAGKAVLWAANTALDFLDLSYHLFDATAAADHFVFEDGIDHLTQVRNIESPGLRNTLRWGERAVGLLGVGSLYNYGRSRIDTGRMATTFATERTAGASRLRAMGLSLTDEAFQSMRVPNPNALSLRDSFKKTATTINTYKSFATFVFLTATQLATGAESIEDSLGLEGPTARKWGRVGIYTSFLSLTAYLLNSATDQAKKPKVFGDKSYRQITPPEARAPLALKWGLAWATFYFAWGTYWDNWSIQERYLTTPYGGKLSVPETYLPWKWEPDLWQERTVAGHALTWGFTGAVWATLTPYQTRWANGITKHFWGFGKEATQFTDAERAILKGSAWYLKPHRSAKLALFTKERLLFTGTSILVGLPLGVLVNQAVTRATKYSSKSASTGTSFRTFITNPLNSIGVTVNTAYQGYTSSWGGYAWNMIPVNYVWNACSMMPDNLEQVATVVADDYKHETDPVERRALRSRLFELWSIAHQNGKDDARENEKTKLTKVLSDAGIDPIAIAAALREKAIKYTPPSPVDLANQVTAVDGLQQYLKAGTGKPSK